MKVEKQHAAQGGPEVVPASDKAYTSFAAFYPFYLSQHANRTCRRLHFFGSFLCVVTLAWVISSQQWLGLLLLPLIGYGFAWVGHFMFERNRPATFTYPLYSLMGDWVMFWQVLTGHIRF